MQVSHGNKHESHVLVDELIKVPLILTFQNIPKGFGDKHSPVFIFKQYGELQLKQL